MTAASLYPFLRPGPDPQALERLMAEVRHSTMAKAAEIAALRRTVLERDGERLTRCAAAMADRFGRGGRLLAYGNGGSSTDAQDLARLFLSPGDGARALPAFALTNDIAVVTALTNDVGFDVVFARQIAAFARPADIAVGLSTSGNSPNLLAGFAEARQRGLLTVGVSGHDGGRMAEVSTVDHLFVVPSPSVHRIQEAQTTIYHVLWELTLTALQRGDHVPGHSG